MTCVFCETLGGELIVKTPQTRIIWAAEAGYPFYIRLVWHEHVKEMTDLSEAQQGIVYAQLRRIETALRKVPNPDKINIASFGNMTPHLHWHIIPRWAGDLHWPQPTWGLVQNPAYVVPFSDVEIIALKQKIAAELTALLTA